MTEPKKPYHGGNLKIYKRPLEEIWEEYGSPGLLKDRYGDEEVVDMVIEDITHYKLKHRQRKG